MTEPLLAVDGLVVEYKVSRSVLRAVDQVDLTVARGETVAVVGESGCGKSTLARAIARLVPIASGKVTLGDLDLTALEGRELRAARRRFQIVFQDPSAALNDRMTVGELVAEPLAVHRLGDRRFRDERARTVLELVGLGRSAARFYPHQFSGGQRQRIAIARAIAVEPELLIADEPTASLDVSIQGQILELLLELRSRIGLAVLLISHDLAVVRALSDRVSVMYMGRVVESACRRDLYHSPRHPYTIGLLASAPRMTAARPVVGVRGELPSALSPPSGCRFRTRCPIAESVCAEVVPPMRALGATTVACHFAELGAESVLAEGGK